MNSKDQIPGEDAFERELAGFQRTAPPDEWHDELIANAAIPASSERKAKARRTFGFRFNLPEKIAGGAFAAAWLVIICLWITAPVDRRSAETQPSTPRMTPGAFPPDQFPMLAWRLAGDETVEELLR